MIFTAASDVFYPCLQLLGDVLFESVNATAGEFWDVYFLYYYVLCINFPNYYVLCINFPNYYVLYINFCEDKFSFIYCFCVSGKGCDVRSFCVWSQHKCNIYEGGGIRWQENGRARVKDLACPLYCPVCHPSIHVFDRWLTNSHCLHHLTIASNSSFINAERKCCGLG